MVSSVHTSTFPLMSSLVPSLAAMDCSSVSVMYEYTRLPAMLQAQHITSSAQSGSPRVIQGEAGHVAAHPSRANISHTADWLIRISRSLMTQTLCRHLFHQHPSGPVVPDIQPDEVGPGEDVVSTEHHPDVRHQNILQHQDADNQTNSHSTHKVGLINGE